MSTPNTSPRPVESPPDDLMPATAFARRKGKDLQAVHRWRLLHGLRAFRIGGRWWFSPSDFNAWVLSRASSGAPGLAPTPTPTPARRAREIERATKRATAMVGTSKGR